MGHHLVAIPLGIVQIDHMPPISFRFRSSKLYLRDLGNREEV